MLRERIGRAIIISGHLMSWVGCRIKGYHVEQDGDYRRYCRLCGRLYR